jgi:hypothetical protein
MEYRLNKIVDLMIKDVKIMLEILIEDSHRNVKDHESDEDDFDKICNLLRFKQIDFAFDKNEEEDILQDIEGFKNEDIEIRDLKFFRIVTVITYG